MVLKDIKIESTVLPSVAKIALLPTQNNANFAALQSLLGVKTTSL